MLCAPWSSRAARALTAIAALGLLASCLGNGDVTLAPRPVVAPPPAEPPPAPLVSGRLPDTARPLRYALSLVVDPTKDRFSGDVTIDVDIPRATSSIVLHARGLTILRAEVASGGDTVSAQATPRMAAGGKDTPEELVLSLARPVSFGRAQIRVAYSGAFSESLSGLYKVIDDGAPYVFTQLEPSDARRMLPCFDEPSFKNPFELKVTTPKGNIVVANAPEASRVDANDGRSVTFAFAPTPPLPTYLFALAVGPLEIREGDKSPVPIRLVTTRGKGKLGDLALSTTSAMVAKLGEYFDRPYPYAKLDLLAVPEFGYGAMENAGLITFREELLLVDEASASTQARRGLAETVSHEIAHHWFGNLVTMAWWDDLWLNEGFATWMEGVIVDAWRPSMQVRLERLAAKSSVMSLDSLDASRSVRQPVTSTSEAEEAFDGIVYEKGASVIGMLERWLGPDTFRAGVRAYIKSHEHGSATAEDLFAALGNASGRDVSAVASTFLDQPGVPLVRAELVCEKKKAPRVTLSQSRYHARPATDAERNTTLWKIPVCIAYEGAEKSAPVCGLMDARESSIELPTKSCPRWMYPNAEESGYYRFALPQKGLASLLRAGKSLDLRERVGMVANAWALVQSGDMRSDELLDLLAGMKKERSRLVLEQMIEALDHISDALVDDASRPAFRAFVSSLLLPIAKELGWDAKKSDTEDQRLARQSVLTALGTLTDDRWMRREADRRAQRFLADPSSVDADSAEIALQVSTRYADDKRLAELIEAATRAKTPEVRVILVRALGSFADPSLLRRGLDAMLDDRIKVQDSVYIYDSANERVEARPLVIAWVKERFPELRSRMPGFVLTRFGGAIEGLCEAKLRDDAGAFFKDGLKNVEGADRALAQAMEASGQCIELRGREAERASKRLRSR